MRLAGFLKVRNEIVREGNLYRCLAQLDALCDGGVICDDASTDGTREHLIDWVGRREAWHLLQVAPDKQNWRKEMHVKQDMLEILHALPDKPEWIFWADGDELLVPERSKPFPGSKELDPYELDPFLFWLEREGEQADVWAFHYLQLWRSTSFYRVDSDFNKGWFWKLWRYRPDLRFELSNDLHRYQFPKTYYEPIMTAVNGHNGSFGKARRAPFEVLHLGNVGKNLQWKAISYRNSGPLESASLERHLYFGRPPTKLVFNPSPYDITDPPRLSSKKPPMPFTEKELSLIERMGDLRQRPGLTVVIIPTFNRGPLLDRTLRSVFNQTYLNWVCIVLDDGSTDNTPDVMRAWQDKDPRFFYCHYPENRGGVAMNEIGMDLACEFGEYWVRLGSDDYFLKHKLELDRVAFDHGARVCWGPYRDLHNEDSVRDLRNLPSDARGSLLSRGFAASWANIAVRTDLLREVKARYGDYCDAKIRNMEDWLVNTRLAYFAEFTWRGIVSENGTPGEMGDLVIGARGADAIGGKPSRIIHDAVWHIAADGASQKSNVCATDAKLTNDALNVDAARFQPTPRSPNAPVRIPNYKIGSI